MEIKYTSVREPRWVDDSKIDCLVKFELTKVEVPFTASASDSEAHGREIFQRAAAGEFGPVAPKLDKPVTPKTAANSEFQVVWPGWPEIEKFLAEVNAENSRKTIRGVALAWGSMLDKLLEALLEDYKDGRVLTAKNNTFSKRITLALGCGVITQEESNSLNNIREIRNAFAHEWDADFGNEKFKKLIPKYWMLYEKYFADTLNFSEDLEFLTRLVYAGACGSVAIALANRRTELDQQRR